MIQTTDDIIATINSDVEGVTSLMLKDLIKTHMMDEGRKRKALWERYTLTDVPIYHRKQTSYTKVDRKIANDFYADIVDTKQGYMGNEVTITVNREEYKVKGELNESEYDKDRLHLRDFQRKTSSEDQNSEMVGMAASTGLGYRLLYVPEKKNEVKTMNLFPWEVIHIFDESLDEAVVAIRYYTVTSTDTSRKTKEITKVEWYDKTDITYYIDDGEYNFHIDTTKGIEGSQPHLFDGVPIIPFPNNGLLTAEPENVTDLIDAYDAIMSSTTSEIEQLRLAYMFLKGAGLSVDDQFMKQLEQTGIFPLDENGEVGFVNKELSDGPVNNLLAEIRKNIYQFAKSIDMSKDFGGDMRVIGWQVTLLNLENSCKITERKFSKALREQYRILSEYWKKYQGVDIDPYNIEFTFVRNFPRDLAAEAEILNSLLGTISDHTAFSQMSFIDDPDQEIAKIEAQRDPFREAEDGDEGSDRE